MSSSGTSFDLQCVSDVPITMAALSSLIMSDLQSVFSLTCLLYFCHDIEGTTSIKMCESDPSHVKETSFTCSLVMNTKKLLVVLKCLKDRTFDSTDSLRLFDIMPLTRSVVEG